MPSASKESPWASREPFSHLPQAHGLQSSGSSAQTPLAQPNSHQHDFGQQTHQVHGSDRRHTEEPPAFLQNGHTSPYGQHRKPGSPANTSHQRHVSPRDYGGGAAQQQHAGIPAYRRASHDGTYQAPGLDRLSFGDTVQRVTGTRLEYFGRGQPEGDCCSSFHIPSDMQEGGIRSSDSHAGIFHHVQPLPNGRGEDTCVHPQSTAWFAHPDTVSGGTGLPCCVTGSIIALTILLCCMQIMMKSLERLLAA